MDTRISAIDRRSHVVIALGCLDVECNASCIVVAAISNRPFECGRRSANRAASRFDFSSDSYKYLFDMRGLPKDRNLDDRRRSIDIAFEVFGTASTRNFRVQNLIRFCSYMQNVRTTHRNYIGFCDDDPIYRI